MYIWTQRLKYRAPKGKRQTPQGLLFCLLVLGVRTTPAAILFQFYFTRDEFPVLARPVVDALTLPARESEELIL